MDDCHDIYADKLMLLVDDFGAPPAEVAELRQHAESCAACQSELQALSRMTHMLGEALSAHPAVEDLVQWAETGAAGEVASHVTQCPMCEAHVDLLRAEAAQAPAEAAPEAIPADLLAQLRHVGLSPARGETRETPVRPVRGSGPVVMRRAPRVSVGSWVGLLAALLLVAVGSTAWLPRSSDRVPMSAPPAVAVAPSAPAPAVVERDFTPPVLQDLDRGMAANQLAPAGAVAPRPEPLAKSASRGTLAYKEAMAAPVGGGGGKEETVPPNETTEAAAQQEVENLLPGRKAVVTTGRVDGELELRVTITGQVTPEERLHVSEDLVKRFGLRTVQQVVMVTSQ